MTTSLSDQNKTQLLAKTLQTIFLPHSTKRGLSLVFIYLHLYPTYSQSRCRPLKITQAQKKNTKTPGFKATLCSLNISLHQTHNRGVVFQHIANSSTPIPKNQPLLLSPLPLRTQYLPPQLHLDFKVYG
ncbi:hypothetical protein L873DRAFT_1174573 [Choiromyces venosus 120613-1]|uniref:Uncharacterized protein n=1 Tax=Choiromyces venosus 120613-1 TaxID=1336337 RepID=A0A3N4K5P5_9PEZI|nr:hypothetical protein L873DRAFT_1174573 [Choiromyces venosus 120613-1]